MVNVSAWFCFERLERRVPWGGGKVAQMFDWLFYSLILSRLARNARW